MVRHKRTSSITPIVEECTYGEYCLKVKASRKDAKGNCMQEELLRDPHHALRHVVMTGEQHAPTLLEYAGTLTLDDSRLFDTVISTLRISHGAKMEDFKEVVRAAAPAVALRIFESLAEEFYNKEGFEEVVEWLWEHIDASDRVRLLLASGLKTKSCQSRSKEYARSNPELLSLLVRNCSSTDDAKDMLNEFMPGDDWVFLSSIIGNSIVVKVVKESIKHDFSVSTASLLLLLWRVRDWKRSIMTALRIWNAREDAIAFLNEAVSRIAIETELVVAVAKAGLTNVTQALISNQVANSEVLIIITSSIANGKNEWAVDTLLKIRLPMLQKHIGIVKVVLDFLNRLSVQQLLGYYDLLLRLAKYSLSQFGDASLMSELMMIFRKQVTSSDAQARSFGAVALFSLLKSLISEAEEGNDHDDGAEEATCSQAPAKLKSNVQCHTEAADLCETFLTFVTMHNDVQALTLLSDLFAHSNLMNKLSADLMKIINRRVSKTFEKNFIIELTKKHPRHFDVDQHEAMIGLKLINPIVPVLFSLMAETEKTVNGTLDNIDALLGCPLVQIESLELVKIWLVALVNAFYDQNDKEIQQKCIKRLATLFELPDNDDGSSLMEVDDKSNDEKNDLEPLCDELNSFIADLIKANVKLNCTTATDGKVKSSQFGGLCADALKQYLSIESPSQHLISYLADCKLCEWSTEDLKELLNRFSFDNKVTLLLNICEELDRRKVTFSSVISKMNTDLFTGEQWSRYLAISRGNQGTDALEFVKSTQCNSPEAAKIVLALLIKCSEAEQISLLSRLVELLGQVEGSSKKHTIYNEAYAGLSRIRLTSLEDVEKACVLLEKFVGIARSSADAVLIESCLKNGKNFILLLIRIGLSLMTRAFRSHRTTILTILKVLQQATRSLQIICNHVKADRRLKFQSLLPPMRKTLEALLFGVKLMLQENGCVGAFWLGNLKHRLIDGTEVGSQIEFSEKDKDDDGEGSNDLCENGDDASDCVLDQRQQLQQQLLSKDIISDSD